MDFNNDSRYLTKLFVREENILGNGLARSSFVWLLPICLAFAKWYFEYILSYSPYNNLHKTDYPPIFVSSSIFDNRVLYSEPVKYIAKLRDVKNDNNIQLLKCKIEAAGHGGMSGRDNAITELAEEYSFILKTAEISD